MSSTMDLEMMIDTPLMREIRGKGLFIGVEIDPDRASARDVCKALMKCGLLSRKRTARSFGWRPRS